MAENTTDEFEREKLCYTQNFEQFRSLNGQLHAIPPLAITLTGGLWFGASIPEALPQLVRAGLLIFAAFCNFALVLALFRIRDVMTCYLERIRDFYPNAYADGKPKRPILGRFGNYGMVWTYSLTMIVGILVSLAGAFFFYWPLPYGGCWFAGVLILLAGIWWFLVGVESRHGEFDGEH